MFIEWLQNKGNYLVAEVTYSNPVSPTITLLLSEVLPLGDVLESVSSYTRTHSYNSHELQYCEPEDYHIPSTLITYDILYRHE